MLGNSRHWHNFFNMANSHLTRSCRIAPNVAAIAEPRLLL